MARDVNLLIGRDEGLFLMHSSAGGQNWDAADTVLPDVETHVIKSATDGTVYVGTRGRGLFRAKPGLQEWEQIETPAGAHEIRSICAVGDRLVIGTEAGVGGNGPAVGVYDWSLKGGWRQL